MNRKRLVEDLEYAWNYFQSILAECDIDEIKVKALNREINEVKVRDDSIELDVRGKIIFIFNVTDSDYAKQIKFNDLCSVLEVK